MLIGLPLRDPERPGPHELGDLLLGRELLGDLLRIDGGEVVRDREREDGDRRALGQTQLHGVGSTALEVGDLLEQHLARVRLLPPALEGGDHVLARQLLAVVELDAPSELERVGEPVPGHGRHPLGEHGDRAGCPGRGCRAPRRGDWSASRRARSSTSGRREPAAHRGCRSGARPLCGAFAPPPRARRRAPAGSRRRGSRACAGATCATSTRPSDRPRFASRRLAHPSGGEAGGRDATIALGEHPQPAPAGPSRGPRQGRPSTPVRAAAATRPRRMPAAPPAAARHPSGGAPPRRRGSARPRCSPASAAGGRAAAGRPGGSMPRPGRGRPRSGAPRRTSDRGRATGRDSEGPRWPETTRTTPISGPRGWRTPPGAPARRRGPSPGRGPPGRARPAPGSRGGTPPEPRRRSRARREGGRSRSRPGCCPARRAPRCPS